MIDINTITNSLYFRKVIIFLGGILLGIIISRIYFGFKKKKNFTEKIKGKIIESNKDIVEAYKLMKKAGDRLSELYKIILKVDKLNNEGLKGG